MKLLEQTLTPQESSEKEEPRVPKIRKLKKKNKQPQMPEIKMELDPQQINEDLKTIQRFGGF